MSVPATLLGLDLGHHELEDLSLYFHIGNNKYTESKKNKPEVVSLNQRFDQIFSGKC